MTKTARLEVRIDPELKEELERYAAEIPGTTADHVRAALMGYLFTDQRLASISDLQRRVERLERIANTIPD